LYTGKPYLTRISVDDSACLYAMDLEEGASRPLSSIMVSMKHGDGLELKVRNEGTSPALRIGVGRHQHNNKELDQVMLLALPRLILLVANELT
jgi:hypothetical protein